MGCVAQDRGGGQFSVATDLEGNITASKELQVDLGVLKISPALTRYKAGEGLLRCAASCSHTHWHIVSGSVCFPSGKTFSPCSDLLLISACPPTRARRVRR